MNNYKVLGKLNFRQITVKTDEHDSSVAGFKGFYDQ
jgi:hypothetical protein